MEQTIETVINLMAASAIAAPKAGGKDCLNIVAITGGDDLKRIADEMRQYAHNSSKENYWHRDATNTEGAQGLLLIGLNGAVTAGYDCGGCGYRTCVEFEKERELKDFEMGYSGPHCIMRMMDIGVALSSAAKAASMLNIDNRVQQRVGAAVRALGYIECEVAMGIPISISGKSIFYDRKTPSKASLAEKADK
ncbi:hypothetical protein BOW53_09255 [Solemya pervernicosa gill symbiont]|uniref:4Fe-4S domain-containing protein n=2 Tax=Gammaproteobacteria incertae sedis TaxID=118884 RepID=A0A1T2L4L7_9GAMM|nr:DUF2148 domain-containing protein [Candidatus Reidiella endopervernicosa]OOZ40014.1 hypothetical protein BOW53_09255 [Solemya pervernicosa gill symbiont]QKQ25297.1 hypothetical protein HUE57_02565 [Candidatus Reidiella endopervernicosa]